jgi:dipeptidyl aminopeptidase/acylaminoacyl peptidase
MLDGKEVFRGPMQPQMLMPLQFARDGQHLAFAYGHSIYIDGKPGPVSRAIPHLFFSVDGNHYAYADDEEGKPSQWTIIDGQQRPYAGDILQITNDGRAISVLRDPANHIEQLMVDGQPQFKAANIGNVWISDDGKQIAVAYAATPNGKTSLSINGKDVPGSEGALINNVIFSPDGKRYAAHCHPNGSECMLVDGKKGDTYNSIPEQVQPYDTQRQQWINPALNNAPRYATTPAFTSDSSKFVYIAVQGSNHFLVTEDGEYDDFTGSILGSYLELSDKGGHYGFCGVSANHKQAVVIDGKPTVLPGGAQQMTLSNLAFSPDGSHYGVMVGIGNTDLYVDGKVMPGGILNPRFIFSPDGNHVLYVCRNSSMAMDGKIIPVASPLLNVTFPMFSPDSRHVYWISTSRIPNSKDTQQLYVDGKPACHFDDIGLGHGLALNDTITNDGVLTFMSRTEGTLTKFVVTPDSSIDDMLKSAKPAK